MGRQLRVLIIVENLPVPFDRRVWSEATTLRDAGHSVSVICPKAPGYQRSHEIIDGISDLSPSLADRGAGRSSLFRRVPDRVVLGVSAFAESLASSRLRRDPRLQSARPHFPDRSVLQDFRRQELRLRPSRRQSGVLSRQSSAGVASSGSCCGLPRSSPSRPPISPSPRTSPIAASPSSEAACAPERVFVVRSGPNLDRVKKPSRRSWLAQGSQVPRRLCGRDQPDPRGSICCSLRSSHIV